VSFDDGAYGIAVTGKATPSGDLYNEAEDKKPQSSGRVYNSLFVRHWDHWVTENRNAIFLGTLKKEGGKYKLSELKNALKGSKLESPIDPFGGTNNFDISSQRSCAEPSYAYQDEHIHHHGKRLLVRYLE
jgi:hypothetical protein